MTLVMQSVKVFLILKLKRKYEGIIKKCGNIIHLVNRGDFMVYTKNLKALKVITFICFISIFTFSFNTFAYNSAAEKVKIKAKLNSIELVYNDHVGNEWGYSATVNKKSIEEVEEWLGDCEG